MAFLSLARGGGGGGGKGCQQKQKKSIDQTAPQIGYEGIKSLRSLAMKNYLVTGGLLSLVESYNNPAYTFDCQKYDITDILTARNTILQIFYFVLATM